MEANGEIQGFGDLKDAYNEEFRKAQADFKRLMSRMAELTPQIPKIAAETVQRGLEAQKAKIDADFGEIDSLISDRFDANGEAQIKRENDRQWVEQNADRSKIVTGAVTNVKNMSTNTRTAAVNVAVKLTSVIGKGLTLFGQKGLAKQMQESVIDRGKDYIARDSRISRLMQRVAEGGFRVADGARNYIKNTRDGINDVREQTDLNYMNLGREASLQSQESREWQNAHEDRSSTITGAVKGVNEASLGFKTFLAQGKIKVMSLAAKGVALTGKKGLAQEIAARGFDADNNIVKRESRLGRFAEKLASSIFKQTDNFREGVDNTKTMAEAYASAGVQTVKDTAQVARDGILEFGKAHYRGVAKVAGIAALPLMMADTGVEYASGKVSDGIEFVQEKVGEGLEFVSEKIQDGRDALSIAASKVSRNKTQAQRGIKTFFRDMAASVVGKLDKSITRDDERISQKDEVIQAKQEEIDSRSETKEDGDER